MVLATGAKIVLSTDWRRIPKLKQQLVQTLHEYGCEVIGATPMRAPWHPVRPVEIIDWLRAYNEAAVQRADTEPITSFVAVDDRALLQESGGDELIGAHLLQRNERGRQATELRAPAGGRSHASRGRVLPARPLGRARPIGTRRLR